MVSLGHPLIPALCVCVCVRVCISMGVCTHPHTQIVGTREPSSCMRGTEAGFHFLPISLHDFPHLCSRPGQLSPTLLGIPAPLAFAYLSKKESYHPAQVSTLNRTRGITMAPVAATHCWATLHMSSSCTSVNKSLIFDVFLRGVSLLRMLVLV